MKIPPVSIPPVPAPPAEGRPAAARTERAAAAGQTGQSAGSRGVSWTASSEVDSLISRMRAMPPVRTQVVEQARERLNRGEYLTRAAAEQTAAAFAKESAFESLIAPEAGFEAP